MYATKSDAFSRQPFSYIVKAMANFQPNIVENRLSTTAWMQKVERRRKPKPRMTTSHSFRLVNLKISL